MVRGFGVLVGFLYGRGRGQLGFEGQKGLDGGLQAHECQCCEGSWPVQEAKSTEQKNKQAEHMLTLVIEERCLISNRGLFAQAAQLKGMRETLRTAWTALRVSSWPSRNLADPAAASRPRTWPAFGAPFRSASVPGRACNAGCKQRVMQHF